MPYELYAFLAIGIFALIHLWAEKIQLMTIASQGKFLSFGGGIAIAYVFIDLLPKLGKSNAQVEKTLLDVVPFVEKHVFIMALTGFLLFYIIERTPSIAEKQWTVWLPILSFVLFNFFVGYAVVDKDNPEIKPLFLFTFAFALHYFTNDYSLSTNYASAYENVGRWLLVAALFIGGVIGVIFELSPTAVALLNAFIGGGVIMNVTRHELSEARPNDIRTFLSAALFYTVILLSISS